MPRAADPKIPSFAEARRRVEEYASRLSPTDSEMLSLLESAGLVLAEDLRADRDFPPFPRSTRDGFAVRAADLSSLPAKLKCVGEIKAGASLAESRIKIAKGEAAEIMTGAPVPDGADAVVMVEYTMVEYTSRDGNLVSVERAVVAGENIVAKGSEALKGDLMVERGTRVNHITVAIAAAVGRAEVAVYRRPRVAILATGDELVDINLRPGPNEIRNSNSYSLAAQVQAAGGEPMLLPVARDDAGELALLLRKGFEADLLLITGGVSMGKYDLVEQVLASFEAEFFFTAARIQPGKPVVFGEVARSGVVQGKAAREGIAAGKTASEAPVRGVAKLARRATPFFGLPGNPVSTMVTFHLFARPVIDALSGARPQPLAFAQAKLKNDLTSKIGLTRFLPAKLSGGEEQPEVELLHWHGSGDLMAVSRSNCYIVVPPDRDTFNAGENITVLMT